MIRLTLLAVGLLLVLPAPAQAQEWTPEQQEVIDALTTCWNTWVEGIQDGSPDAWLDNCTEEGFSYWWRETPLGEQMARRNWTRIMESDENWLDLSPLVVKVYDDFAIVHFWGYWAPAEGDILGRKLTEIFRKVDGRWLLVAGHSAPADS